MIDRIERFIISLETTPMSVAGWLAAFIGVEWIRYLIESFSNQVDTSGYLISDIPTLVHYTIFYISVAVLTVVLVSAVAKIDPSSMMRTVVFLMPVMWLAPLIDLVSGGTHHIAYIINATPTVWIKNFFTFGGQLTGVGATLGLRIELGVMVLMLGVYIYVKTKQLSKVFLPMVVVYSVMFISGSMPSILGFFLPNGGILGALSNSLISHNFLHPSEIYPAYRTMELFFDASMSQIFYLILCMSGFIWLYRVHKNIVIAMLKNIPIERFGHFFVVAFLGGLIAFAEGSRVNWTILDITTIVVAFVTITFAGLIIIITNDLSDKQIDAISNPRRPLITGTLTPQIMKDAAIICGFMALLGALSLGSYATFFIFVLSASYYIYSAPPLRLKRVPILASALIGISTLAIMMLGFFLISNNQTITAFPAPIALLAFLFMTLSANLRDLKDIKGDAAAGIKTLPTLLGDKRSRMVIGVMMFIAYALFPILIPIQILWIPSIIAGIISFIWLIQGKGEKPIFALYFIYLIGIVILLYFV